MNCPDVQRQLSLYLYGEVDFATEEELEKHLNSCAFCQMAFAREKTWHTAATSEQCDVPLELLSVCRQGLRSAVRAHRANGGGAKSGLRGLRFQWPAFLRITPTRWSYQLALGSFLVFVGFTGGRFVDNFGFASGDTSVMTATLNPFTRIRDIQSNSDGRVHITLDRVDSREVVGSRDDENVKRWLLIGVQDSADPGIRVDSVEMLDGQSGTDVRDALLERIERDPNAAVRLKALQAVGRFRDDPAVRASIRSVLEHDGDPAVRSAAIDVLAPANRPAQIGPELTQTLQMLAHSERDDYVRSRCLELLHAIDSPGSVY